MWISLSKTVISAFALVFLSSASGQQPDWPHTWGGSGNTGKTVCRDKDGNVYVAGSTTSFGAGGSDVLILKYTSSGTFQWAKTWGGSGDETAYRIAVRDGYVYVTGGTSSFGAGWYDLFLLQLDTNGNLTWGKAWGGSSFEQGYDIGFDQDGNIYVSGESYSNGNCAVILKFSAADGSLLPWSVSWKGPATYDTGYSLTVDSDFNVILAGTSWDYSVSPNHNSILLVKFSSTGGYMWSQSWSTPIPGQDEVGTTPAVTTDTSGNIYVGATHSSDCQSSNFESCAFSAMLLKTDSGGNFQWGQTWGGPGYNSVGGIGFDPSASGHLLVSGVENASGTTPSPFVFSFDTAGDLLSSTAWGGAQSFLSDIIPSMAVGSAGNTGLVGAAQGNGGAWVAVSASGSDVSNSFSTVPYTVGTPAGQLTTLTIPTQSQDDGPKDKGGLLVAFHPSYLNTSPSPFLSFPLMNKTPSSASITSVFDHSMNIAPGNPVQYGYCPDQIVTAFTGEQGDQSPTLIGPAVPPFTCAPPNYQQTKVTLYGYGNGQPFFVNGHYTGGLILFYDGHPGIDYVTTDQKPDGSLCNSPNCNKLGKTPVLAAAPGKVLCVNITEQDAPSPCWPGAGEIEIDHGNGDGSGYRTLYLHLSSSVAGLAPGDHVIAGQEIGMSGDVGAEGGPHLHFEVLYCYSANDCVPVDPYGWTGPMPDPYTRAVNFNLWQIVPVN